MTSPTVMAPPRAELEQNRRRFFAVRVGCWVIALVLGGLQAWSARFAMNPDGISYLDIGDAYWRHDWHNAINAYWSPLYSWILGFFVNVIKPSPRWEYPLVHFVNFLIYIGALCGFEYILSTLVFSRNADTGVSIVQTEVGLPTFFWWVAGYGVFITASLFLNGLQLATPDVCVAAFVYFATALLFKILLKSATRGTFCALGMILGFAYLTKAVMFPLGFVFLLTLPLCGGRTAISFKNMASVLVCFLLVASPFIVMLSGTHNRLTFSSVGPVAYEVYVDGFHQFIPEADGLAHPVRKLSNSPRIYDYASPIHGTYPLWYDPAYWHEGLRPFWSTDGERKVVTYGLAVYLYIIFISYGVILVSLIGLRLVAPPTTLPSHNQVRSWLIAVPAFCALLIYLIVYTEPRYVAPFCCILCLLAFSGIRVNRSRSWSVLLAFIATVVLAQSVYFARKIDSHTGTAGRGIPVYSDAAESLSELGIRTGDVISVVGSNTFGEGGAFVARLARVKIVSEFPDMDNSWMTNQEKCHEVMALLIDNHVKGILLLGSPPATSSISWTKLGTTNYYFHALL